MAFDQYLPTADIRILTEAAVSAQLLEVDRSLLLAGIHGHFRANLQHSNKPLEQFQLDLNAVNRVERLANGTVPLVQFLLNAAAQLSLQGRQEAEVFERFANIWGNRTSGITNLPAPATLPEVIRPEAIIGEDDMVAFDYFSGGLAAGGSVMRIRVPRFEGGTPVMADRGQPWVMLGTAWLIGPELAITNHHVINARVDGERPAPDADLRKQALAAVIEFDFNDGAGPAASCGVKELVEYSVNLDYAILSLENAPLRPALRLHRKRVETDATRYLSVNIIQHPRGESKRVAFRNNLVTSATGDQLRYLTDTDSGSSGSPVCDDQWRVVALHRGAVQTALAGNYNGRNTAFVNYGTQIAAILADLAQRNPRLSSDLGPAQTL